MWSTRNSTQEGALALKKSCVPQEKRTEISSTRNYNNAQMTVIELLWCLKKYYMNTYKDFMYHSIHIPARISRVTIRWAVVSTASIQNCWNLQQRRRGCKTIFQGLNDIYLFSSQSSESSNCEWAMRGTSVQPKPF